MPTHATIMQFYPSYVAEKESHERIVGLRFFHQISTLMSHGSLSGSDLGQTLVYQKHIWSYAPIVHEGSGPFPLPMS